MPPPDAIVAQLTAIANRFAGVAIAWHAIVAAALVAWSFGWRPRARSLAVAMVVPVASFGVVAASAGNVFNAIAAALSIVTLRLAARTIPAGPASRGNDASLAAGCTLMVFGWTYPHFLPVDRPLAYLYAAPLGVLPCPTLTMLAGATLATGDLGSRWWPAALGTIALFYGAFGVAYLGVWLDVVLLCGGLLLLYRALLRRSAGTGAARGPVWVGRADARTTT